MLWLHDRRAVQLNCLAKKYTLLWQLHLRHKFDLSVLDTKQPNRSNELRAKQQAVQWRKSRDSREATLTYCTSPVR